MKYLSVLSSKISNAIEDAETRWGIAAMHVAPIIVAIYLAVLFGAIGLTGKAWHFMVRSILG